MRWNQRGPSERIPPVCNYCELTYGARTRGARPGTRGAFRDRRLATQVMALAEARILSALTTPPSDEWTKVVSRLTQERDEAREESERLQSWAAEKERLRFEGDLDKWMKIIGAGITGFQPEAYAVMDETCREFVRLREENERLRQRVKALEELLGTTEDLVFTAIKRMRAGHVACLDLQNMAEEFIRSKRAALKGGEAND